MTDSGPGIRALSDDTLVAFISDTHMGGDPGADLFEAHSELAALLDELATHAGPVELVLAGDIFDLLRIGDVPAGEDRVSVTLGRSEYAALIENWGSFAAGPDHRVVYLPGNHDVEVWWNPSLQATLRSAGLVHDFALSYAARFESAPDLLVYSEHGNQLDPANTRLDYADRSETPIGDHVVAELIRPFASRVQGSRGLPLQDLPHVYPLTLIPDWLAGRFFYDLLRRVVSYVLLPLVVIFGVLYGLSFAIAAFQGEPPDPSGVGAIVAEVGRYVAIVVVTFFLFFVVVRRAALRALTLLGPRASVFDEEVASLDRVEAVKDSDRVVPHHPNVRYRDIDVWVWGHSHAPSLNRVRGASRDGIAANCGCWLRQVRPVSAHFRAPPVFVPRFVLTHVRVHADPAGLRVELWEHARRAPWRLSWIERLAVLGKGSLTPHPRSGLVASLTLARDPRPQEIATPAAAERSSG
jgi:UDP-2,3-diacylglucosamine pyrophosphatase LpxH